ncbi:hypothetical protein FXO37_25967 [Capsicum annuum]|nr:hypothetical protein FXO37_25967 [Capsicum annuum]
MVGCSQPSCTYHLFWGINISSSSNDKEHPNYRPTTQSNPNEQNVEFHRNSLYWGLILEVEKDLGFHEALRAKMLSLEDEVNMVMGQYLGAFEGFLGKFPSAYAVSSTLGIALNGRERVDVIGALLGFYGALSALALTHHWVIWFVAAQVYPGVPFTRYTILGDNIIIRDERVAECYRELIPPLNVPFSLEKSLVSSVGALEFGKRFFVRRVTKDFFPVSCHMLRSLVSSISLIPVMRAIMSNNHPLSFHLWEAGYRVYTRSTAPLYDSGQKVVHKSVADLFFYHVSHTLI